MSGELFSSAENEEMTGTIQYDAGVEMFAEKVAGITGSSNEIEDVVNNGYTSAADTE